MNKSKPVILIILISLSVFALVWATDFSVNTHRFDPYKQFKFRVKWDGRYVSGIITVNGLHRDTAVITNSDSQNEIKTPGRTVYQPIVLERGRTHDTAFENWANKVYEYSNRLSAPHDYRKDIIIELCNEAGQLVMAFKVYNCWPSHYSPIKELNANTTDIAVETLTLQYDGWERDMEVIEPQEPSYTEP
jgi:phage tail-like protein